MTVFGVDPGTATTGYGIVARREDGTLEHRGHGVITTPPSMTPERRLAHIYKEMSSLLHTYRPDVVAVEELFFKNNVTTGISVAQARGVILLAAAHAGLAVVGYKPAQIKQGITGVGRATKEQMRIMTQVLLGLRDKPKRDDAADGLAVAICHLHCGPAELRVLNAINAR